MMAWWSVTFLLSKTFLLFFSGLPLDVYKRQPIGSSDQTSLDAFAVDQIDHVEVYKGIIPSWLGGEGLGGAINIILRHEEQQDHLTASYEVGSFHTHKGSLRANKYLPALGLNLSLALQGLYTDNDLSLIHI